MELFLNHIKDGILLADSTGVARFLNDEAARLLSVRREVVAGKPLRDWLLIQNDQGRAVDAYDLLLREVIEHGSTVSMDQTTHQQRYFFVRSDRSLFPVATTAMPSQPLGFEAGVVLIFHDLSADERIDEAKSEFISLISHQLRTPVNIVSWYAEKLLAGKRGPLNAKQLEYLQEITTGNQRVTELISAIVNVSRTNLERLKSKREAVDLVAVVEEAVTKSQTLALNHAVRIDKIYHLAEAPLAGSDKEYLGTIATNLLTNAIKYSVNGGSVSIDIQPVEANAVLDQASALTAPRPGYILAVRDRGLGIPDDQKQYVFSKLFRADNVKSLEVTGLGIGLFVARAFCEALGGRLWFESKLHDGSTFYVYLPKD